MAKLLVPRGTKTDLLKLADYFAEQARHGKFVVQVSPFWFTFEVREPAEMKYHLVPINNHDELEQVQALEGWQYLLIGNDFAVIYAPEGTPLSLVHDRDTMLIKLHYMRVMYLLRFLLAAAGLLFSMTAVYQYWMTARWLSICAIVLSALLLGFALFELFPLINLQRNMKKLQNEQE